MAKKVETTVDELEELSGLVAQASQLEAENRDVGGRQYSYIKIVGNSANDPITKKGKPEYIEGAEAGMFVIPTKKLCLGDSVDLTVLGMFKLYEDSIAGEQTEAQKKAKQEPMRKTVGFWLPQDAENIPVEGIFDRPYTDKNGTDHLLRPIHWVFVRLEGNPEIDDALITFRSTGNSVYKQLQKLISQNATTCTELRLNMTTQEIKSKSYDKDYLYPFFEIVGKNYLIDEDGKVGLAKKGFDKATLVSVIKTSHAMQKEYAEQKLVSKKGNLAAIVAGMPSGKVQLEDKRAEYQEDEDDGGKPAKF